MPEIILQHVTKRFDKFVAVQDLDLQIQDRGFITLLGPSGCGKTTTLRMIAGLETPTSGRILIDGTPVFDSEKGINLPPNKRDIGFLFQNYALWPHMTVYENIAFVLRVIDAPTSYIKKRVAYVIDLVGLQDKAKNYPNELSGGEMQRVAIARALVNDPQLIIADEPTGNIDPELSYEIVDLLREINECGTTILMVTHEHSLVRYFGGRIITIQQGRIVFDEVVGGNLIHES